MLTCPRVRQRDSIPPWLIHAAALLLCSAAWAEAPTSVDLSTASAGRVLGSEGDGRYGVPVAGGLDVDGDGFADSAFSAMLADPSGRTNAGEVYLVFGTGSIADTLDTGTDEARILHIIGEGTSENTGSELWMDDIDGDGLGDLLVGRQNFSPDPGRMGAGALTIIYGSASLKELSSALTVFDLGAPPSGTRTTTLVGGSALERMGIWFRTGDADGDGVSDIVVGADQQSGTGVHGGAVYLLRGGTVLGARTEIDFLNPVTGVDILWMVPPAANEDFHLGGTCALADLDGDGRAEVMASATVFRAGASLIADGQAGNSAHGAGGQAKGAVYIHWGDALPALPWNSTVPIVLDAGADISVLVGGEQNLHFGEEIVAGDFDGDSRTDLFVGDIDGDYSPQSNRRLSGAGTLFFQASLLRGQSFEVDSTPATIAVSRFAGAAGGDIASDTAFVGDFDGDGLDDLGFSAPHATADGRGDAGIIYIFPGYTGTWPTFIDLSEMGALDGTQQRWRLIVGARGTQAGNVGDTLGYSGMSGDLNGDGREELITNEMMGDGTGASGIDRGNLIWLDASLVATPEGDPPPVDPGIDPFIRGGGCSQALAQLPGLIWFVLLAAAYLRRRS